ncbi:unnamed protein product, partial [Effrenium voratum]
MRWAGLLPAALAAPLRTWQDAETDLPLMTKGLRMDLCEAFGGDVLGIIKEILLTGAGLEGFAETWLPRISELPGDSEVEEACALPCAAVYLFMHVAKCDPRVPGDGSGLAASFHCSEGSSDPVLTLVDQTWLLYSVIFLDWTALTASRGRIVFNLLAMVQESWQFKELPDDCSEMQKSFLEALQHSTADSAITAAAEYLAGNPEEGSCGLLASAVAWMALGEESAPAQPMNSCASLMFAQEKLKALWILNELSEAQRVGSILFGLAVPVFPALERTSMACSARMTVGGFKTEDWQTTEAEAEEEEVERAALQEIEQGQLPLPFAPDFDAADRARHLQVLAAFHDLCRELGIPYLIIRGPILGLARHHGTLPWENDGDVCVPKSHEEDFLTLLLLLHGNTPQACLARERCRAVAAAAEQLRGSFQLYFTVDAKRAQKKLLFFDTEDTATVLSNTREVSDPIMDVYLCNWPEADKEDFIMDGEEVPAALVFPLRRWFLDGLSVWSMRNIHGLLDTRYGRTWQSNCRSPNWRSAQKRTSSRPWPKKLPCSALDVFFPRVELEVEAPQVPQLRAGLAAWACDLWSSLDEESRPTAELCALEPEGSQEAEALVSAGRVNHYLLGLELIWPDLYCEAMVLLWPAPQPVRHSDTTVILSLSSPGNPAVPEAALEVESFTCFRLPVRAWDTPLWDVEKRHLAPR